MRTPLTLCADDLGQSGAISEAILDLVRSGRINAATLMVYGGEAAAAAAAFSGLRTGSLGLHVTLSGEEVPVRSELAPDGRLPHVDALTARAFAGRLPTAAVAAEIDRQFDRFEALVGRRPDFVDGHQHVHVLPGIRRLFLAAVRRRAPDAWIRTCEESPATIWRRGAFRWIALRSSLLSRGLGAQAARMGLRTNHGFAGLYDFRAQSDYGALFGRWLRRPGALPLLICHPSHPDPTDPIGTARFREYQFLAGAAMPDQIGQAGLVLDHGRADRASRSRSAKPAVS